MWRKSISSNRFGEGVSLKKVNVLPEVMMRGKWQPPLKSWEIKGNKREKRAPLTEAKGWGQKEGPDRGHRRKVEVWKKNSIVRKGGGRKIGKKGKK